MAEPQPNAVLTIDLGAVAANWRRLAAIAAPAECAAVVKADAYGLGAARVAPALAAAGARSFFVAQLGEAAALRPALPDAAIAVLGGLLPGDEALHLEARAWPVLNQRSEIEAWAAFARARGSRLPAFIHLDSGMSRLGLSADDTAWLAANPAVLESIELRGWLSHLACSEEPHNPMNEAQRLAFAAALARLPSAPASLANSSGIFRGPAYHLDMVRPGAALYGINPTPAEPDPMQPVVRLDARILQLRRVDSPMTVGYGATHRVGQPGRIATISIGYADGLLRALGPRGAVRVAGRTLPIVGRISMDLITIDVSTVPEAMAAPGQWVEIIGPGRPLDDVAADAGTIGYEMLTRLGRRYARRYLEPAS